MLCGDYATDRPKMINLTSVERNALLHETSAPSGADRRLFYKKRFFQRRDEASQPSNRQEILDLFYIIIATDRDHPATRAKDGLRPLFDTSAPVVPGQLDASKWIKYFVESRSAKQISAFEKIIMSL